MTSTVVGTCMMAALSLAHGNKLLPETRPDINRPHPPGEGRGELTPRRLTQRKGGAEGGRGRGSCVVLS